MEIRVVSSLTADDEVRVAPVLLDELAQLLGRMPIAYDIRIQTAGDRVFSCRHPQERPPLRTRLQEV
jgi:hypothetical protein